MTIKPFDFKLKDGRTATLLSPRDEDINGVIEYLKISAGTNLSTSHFEIGGEGSLD